MFTRWVQLSHQALHSFMSPQVTLCSLLCSAVFSTGSGAWLTTVRTQGTGAADIRTVWHQHSLLYTQVAVSLNVPLFVSGQVEHSFLKPNTYRHNLSLTRKCLVWTLNFSSDIIFSQCHLIMTRPPDIHIMCLPAGCWGQTGGLSLPAPSPIPRASAWTNTHNQFVWPCSSWYVLNFAIACSLFSLAKAGALYRI